MPLSAFRAPGLVPRSHSDMRPHLNAFSEVLSSIPTPSAHTGEASTLGRSEQTKSHGRAACNHPSSLHPRSCCCTFCAYELSTL